MEFWRRLLSNCFSTTASRRQLRPLLRTCRIEFAEERVQFASDNDVIPDQGFLYQDTASRWQAGRFNGEEWISDGLDVKNVVGNWESPVVGDFDGNGLEEIVAFNSGTGGFYEMGFNGVPLSRAIAYISIGQSYDHFLGGDLNGDGRDDIAYRDTFGHWSLLANFGDGFWSYAIGAMVPSIAGNNVLVGDVDGDQSEDLIGFDSSSGDFLAFRWNGGTFQKSLISHLAPSAQYQFLQLVDINGDNRRDIVAQDSFGDWWCMTYSDGYMAGRFFGWTPVDPALPVLIGDIDHDQAADLMSWDAPTGNWWCYPGGNSRQAAKFVGQWNSITDYVHVQLVDIHLDGRTTILGLDSTGNWWSTTSATSYGTVTPIASWPQDQQWKNFVTLDFNGDGRDEIAAQSTETGAWSLLSFNGSNFSDSTLTGFSSPNAGAAKFSTAVDFEGDGIHELATWSEWDGTWTVFNQNGLASPLGMWADRALSLSGGEIIDVNGDAQLDVVYWDRESGRWFAGVSDGQSITFSYVAQWNAQSRWQPPLYSDVDGDGATDVIARDELSGDWWAIRFDGEHFRSQVIGNWNPVCTYNDYLFADIDGNGLQELVGRGDYGGWWALMFDGATFRNVSLGITDRAELAAVLAADLNGDQTEEAISFDAATGRWWSVSLINGQYAHRVLAIWDASRSYSELRVVDFEGDGLPELAGWDASARRWRVLQNDAGETMVPVMANWNESGDWQNFVSGDMDDDGREEIVGQDVNTGTWTSLWFEEEEFVTESILTTTRAQAVRLMDYDRDEKEELVWQSFDSEEWSSLQFLDDAFASVPLNEAVAPAGSNVWVGKLPGYSVETLRAILYRDIPGLSTALSTDSLHAAALLLSWCANAVNAAVDSRTFLATNPNYLPVPLADVFFRDYLNNRRSSFCLGYAEFYGEVLELFEIPSIRFDFGLFDPYVVHATVLVPQLTEHGWKFYMLDPTFNSSFWNQGTGERADLLEMIDSLATGTIEDVSWTTGSFEARKWLSVTPLAEPYELVSSSDDLFIYNNPSYSLQNFLNDMPGVLGTGLEAFVRLMTEQVLKIDTSSAPIAASSLVEELTQRQIPILQLV